MKHRFVLWILALTLLAGVVALTRYPAQAAPPKKPLEMTFKDMNGKPVKLSSYRGKVVVLDIWATWCGYCVEEIPGLIGYQKMITNKKLPVQLIGVSVDRDKNAVAQFQRKTKFNYPVVLGDDKTLQPLGPINGIPVKFIIDKQGRLVETRVGAMRALDLAKIVEKYSKAK